MDPYTRGWAVRRSAAVRWTVGIPPVWPLAPSPAKSPSWNQPSNSCERRLWEQSPHLCHPRHHRRHGTLRHHHTLMVGAYPGGTGSEEYFISSPITINLLRYQNQILYGCNLTLVNLGIQVALLDKANFNYSWQNAVPFQGSNSTHN